MDKSKKRAISPSKYERIEQAVWDEAIDWDTTPDFIYYDDGVITRKVIQHGEFLYWEEREHAGVNEFGWPILKHPHHFRKHIKEVFS